MGQTNPKEAILGGLTHVKPTDLVKALSETAQFGSFRERQTFIRLTASEEAWRTLQRWLDWEGPALVVTDRLVQLLKDDGEALRSIAEATRPKAGPVVPAVFPVPVRASVAEKRARKEYDVFLCHNSKDKAAVLAVAEALLGREILPWLDVWDLQPGMRWQPEIERQIDSIGAAAVFAGSSGFGQCQDEESDAILRRFKRLKRPAIPVILADAPADIQLPAFLDSRTRVDFRKSQPDPLNQLIFGITGRNPAFEVE